MNGILILAHGSKRKETEKILNSLVDKVKGKTGEDLVVPSYLQFSDQNLEKAVESLVNKGVKYIRIVPVFLFDGVHVTEDIPGELNDIRSKFPGVEIKMGRHIGDDDKLVDIIVDRIGEIC